MWYEILSLARPSSNWNDRLSIAQPASSALLPATRSPATLPRGRSATLGHWITFWLLVIGFCLDGGRSGQAEDIDPQAVREAIDRGIAYLKREQSRDGTWSDWTGQPGGVTALCTLALLNAGVPVEDPSMQRALTYLRKLPPEKTYATALQTMVLCEADPKADLLLIDRNAKWLVGKQVRNGPNAGGWSYPGNGGNTDNSNTQFAVLALQAAEDAGINVSDQTWRLILKYWNQGQANDGSWNYQNTGIGAGTGSMTCAGIASYVIASGRLTESDAEVVNGQVQCCARKDNDPTIERALAWLGARFSVNSNPGNAGWWLYYMYALERVGRMTAERFIGSHDWYREGTDVLLRGQDRLSGFWVGRGNDERNPHIATSYALLFLSKGRRPVLMGKLAHAPGDDWNNHRSDVANLTHYTERKWDQKLTWQVVRGETADAEDLLQSPVLFLNGRNAPAFSKRQINMLREYVDRGGFIFAEACCDGENFDRGFRKLMEEMFPEPEHRLRLLSPEHPVWRAEERVDPELARPLWGVDVGCRTSVIYCPEDISCYWELSRSGRERQLPVGVSAEVAAANAIGINVLAYATNRELKFKDELLAERREEGPEDRVQRGKLSIAKLRHTGGWNVAPAALSNLQRFVANELGVRVDTTEHEFPINDAQLFNYHLVFMHGRNSFRLSAAERQQLRTYIERGGMLFADAVCGSEEFARAFRREMAAIFPDAPLERISIDDPLFTPEFSGFDIRKVQRREPQRGDPSGPLKADYREVEPDLEGIRIGDRYGVIFSPYDLSCALEKHASLECAGYSSEDAARIGINVVLYSLNR